MLDFIYIFIECLIVSLCLWAGITSFRIWHETRKLKRRFYSRLNFWIGVFWLLGGAARAKWALTMGWAAGSVWPWIWLSLWFASSALYGFKSDADLQISRWGYYKDIIRANSILTARSAKILVMLVLAALLVALGIFFLTAHVLPHPY